MIIRDLKNFASYKSGKVYLVDNMFIRNNEGDVCKIGLEWRYTDYISIMYNSKL